MADLQIAHTLRRRHTHGPRSTKAIKNAPCKKLSPISAPVYLIFSSTRTIHRNNIELFFVSPKYVNCGQKKLERQLWLLLVILWYFDVAIVSEVCSFQ